MLKHIMNERTKREFRWTPRKILHKVKRSIRKTESVVKKHPKADQIKLEALNTPKWFDNKKMSEELGGEPVSTGCFIEKDGFDIKIKEKQPENILEGSFYEIYKVKGVEPESPAVIHEYTKMILDDQDAP